MTDYNAMSNEELSAEVARRLFGWYQEPDIETPEIRWWFTPEGVSTFAPYYATDHNAAWLVVTEMRKRGWLFKLEGAAPGLTDATFWSLKPGGWVIKSAQVSEGEEPRAICEAALAAKDAEEAK